MKAADKSLVSGPPCDLLCLFNGVQICFFFDFRLYSAVTFIFLSEGWVFCWFFLSFTGVCFQICQQTVHKVTTFHSQFQLKSNREDKTGYS